MARAAATDPHCHCRRDVSPNVGASVFVPCENHFMILTAGLSPAWQQILVFDEVAVGEVNRAGEAIWCASGKVLNVARALWSLQADMGAVCPLGGLAGEAIRKEFATDGVPAHWVATTSPTRVCTTVIERMRGRVTEFVENAGPITACELAAFEAAYTVASADARLVVLTGSLPDVVGGGQPCDLYRTMMSRGPRGIIDVRGPELDQALNERPLLVKPNRAELATTVGRPLPGERDVLAAMRELNMAGAEWVLITSDAADVLLTSRASAWRFTPAPAPLVNPIGCGDCLAAGIAAAIDDGAEMVEAVRFGLGAAADNLGKLLPACLDRARVTRFAQAVQVNSL